MKKIMITAMLALFVGGCASVNHVHVNGYLNTAEFQKPVSPAASFFVQTEKNAQNPLFNDEVKTKIENLLRFKGYRIAPYEKADHFINFDFSMSPGRVVTQYQPVYHFGEIGTIVSHNANGQPVVSQIQYPGYTSYVPWQREEYTASLTLAVMAAAPFRDANEKKAVWVGEAMNSSEDQDSRRGVTYLLTALSRHFMEDTHASVVTNVRSDDPELETLSRPALISSNTFLTETKK